METRFKRFMSSRRSRSAQTDDRSACQTYQATPLTTQSPILLDQSTVNSALQARRMLESDAMPMRSLSYEHCVTGKAPILVPYLPKKGNGPVKLQTNRRLSSGDLITTDEDSQQTLQDIKEGEYIVGRKDRSSFQSQRRTTSSFNDPRLSSTSQTGRPFSPSPVSRTLSSQTCPSTPRPHCDDPPAPFVEISLPATKTGLGLISSTYMNSIGPSQDSQLDYPSSSSHHSSSYESSWSRHSPMSDKNATLEALRKAEYGRLVELYGSDTAARNIARLDRQHLRRNSKPTSPASQACFSIVLEPLPAIPTDSRELDPKRTSHQSGTSESCCDEWSRTSSPRRGSYVSSYAESSSATAQTSVHEEEVTTTRENIRSMVEQMRSTYLEAFDNRASTLTKSRPKTKKQRKPRLMPSPTMDSLGQFPVPPATLIGRQTWHSHSSDVDVHSNRRRINSQPVGVSGRLSPIQASPARRDEDDQGLQRADSSTLGTLMADITRAKIRAHQNSLSSTDHTSQNPDRRPITPPNQTFNTIQHSWLNLEPEPVEETQVFGSHDTFDSDEELRSNAQHSIRGGHFESVLQVPADDFDDIYHDLFTTSADGVWPSSSQDPPNTTSIHETQAIESKDSTAHSNLNGWKTSPISSIPESPEYTHLARDNRLVNNFI